VLRQEKAKSQTELAEEEEVPCVNCADKPECSEYSQNWIWHSAWGEQIFISVFAIYVWNISNRLGRPEDLKDGCPP
jgi:hypothetical protein